MVWIQLFSTFCFAALLSTNAGRVGDSIVTSREVMINHLIEEALYRSSSKENKTTAKIRLDNVKDRDFVRETTAVLLETAIFFEAESFSSVKISAGAIAEQTRLVQKKLKSHKVWQKIRVEPQELKDILTRKLRTKEFIRFKMDSASIPISDKEAETYFNNNRLKFENLPFANFKENIKGYLSKQQSDKRLKDWFELLQSKYRVRNYLAE